MASLLPVAIPANGTKPLATATVSVAPARIERSPPFSSVPAPVEYDPSPDLLGLRTDRAAGRRALRSMRPDTLRGDGQQDGTDERERNEQPHGRIEHRKVALDWQSDKWASASPGPRPASRPLGPDRPLLCLPARSDLSDRVGAVGAGVQHPPSNRIDGRLPPDYPCSHRPRASRRTQDMKIPHQSRDLAARVDGTEYPRHRHAPAVPREAGAHHAGLDGPVRRAAGCQGHGARDQQGRARAVGIKLSDVEGRPFWTTFWWQVSDEITALRSRSRARPRRIRALGYADLRTRRRQGDDHHRRLALPGQG